MKSHVVFHEDLMDELEEDFPNYSRKELDELVKIGIQYIVDLTKRPEVTTIKLGNGLGNLHCNFWLLHSEMKDKEKSPVKAHNELARTIYRPRKNIMQDFFDSKTKEVKWSLLYLQKPFILMLKKTFEWKFNYTFGAINYAYKGWIKMAQIQNDFNREQENDD